MIEEYARHNGHADLLRERIDGRLGRSPSAGRLAPGNGRRGADAGERVCHPLDVDQIGVGDVLGGGGAAVCSSQGKYA